MKLVGLIRRLTGRGWKPDPIVTGTLTELYADNELTISAIGDLSSPNMFLSFTSLRHAMGGIQMEEFVGSTRLPGYCALFITDRNASWYNDFPPEQLFDALAPYVAGKRLVTIGHSMGGFGAIWAAKHLKVDVALAFCPQYSVDPAVLPDEHRWAKFRERIETIRASSLEGCFVPDTQFVTINGDGLDEMHWSRFPQAPNCNHILVRDCDHDTAKALKDAGVLSNVIEIVAARHDPLDLIAATELKAQRIG